MEEISDIQKACVHCAEGLKDNDPLNLVGSKYRGVTDKKHPLDTLIEHAEKLKLVSLDKKLNNHKQMEIPLYIHLPC